MQAIELRKILTALLIALTGSGSGFAGAAEVTDVKTPTIKLYDGNSNTANFRSISKQEAKASLPWKVTSSPQRGMVQVLVNGAPAWVKIYAITTDMAISSKVTDTASAPGSRDHIPGVTRGLKENAR
ncbi:MAG: hypothetical protein R3E45_10460 [Rhodocyclaceae bacterium]|nr:hypothetical protein [Rhodocyclaceae bacterium]